MSGSDLGRIYFFSCNSHFHVRTSNTRLCVRTCNSRFCIETIARFSFLCIRARVRREGSLFCNSCMTSASVFCLSATSVRPRHHSISGSRDILFLATTSILSRATKFFDLSLHIKTLSSAATTFFSLCHLVCSMRSLFARVSAFFFASLHFFFKKPRFCNLARVFNPSDLAKKNFACRFVVGFSRTHLGCHLIFMGASIVVPRFSSQWIQIPTAYSFWIFQVLF